uniref:complement C1q-like protein 4 n=1 Tax=Semicossyphus pulcher TaxID=241346 RepID=UPI0037E93A11
MDRSVLLVVLCLQVFLLISTFTSTDGASLKTDPQQPRGPLGRKEERAIRYKPTSNCSWRVGACGQPGQPGLPGPPRPPPPPPPKPDTEPEIMW